MREGDSTMALITHPTGLIIGALNGVTDPIELGIPADELERRVTAQRCPDCGAQRDGDASHCDTCGVEVEDVA